MARLDRGGWSLAYEVRGGGDETLVLTHGLGSTGAVWHRQVAACVPTRRVVSWDLRAHGASGSPAAPCDVPALAGDLAAIVRATAAGAVDLLGFSAGGVLAMRLAIDHPALVRRLILVGTSSECNGAARDRYRAMAATAERDGGAAILPAVGVRDPDAVPPDGPGFARVARAIGAMHDAPLTGALADTRCPALVIVGERDPLGVGGSVIIHRALAARSAAPAHLAILPGLRHAVFREDPEEFNRRVLAFLTSGA